MSTAPALERTARAGLPAVVYILAAGTFLMGTSEFVVAGMLTEVAWDFGVGVGEAGLSITVFAIGMIVGAPSMALLTLRLPRRVTLALALAVFALGHLVVAVTDSFGLMLAARFVTAIATGAFWAVASVVAAQAAGPTLSSRALGIVLGGGMLANVLGVPLGSFGGQVAGWRGTFWALAILAAIAAVTMARLVPADAADCAAPSVRAELSALRSGRLWLTLATCAMVTGGVLSIYSYIAPLLTDLAGADLALVPVALVLFGVAALFGNVLGGRLGGPRPYATILVAAGTTLAASVGLALFAHELAAVLVLFTLLGFAGLSANPILVALAVRFGGAAPTLATAMPTSIFNLGTAIGTGISAALIGGPFGAMGPVLVGAVGAVLIAVPIVALAVIDRRGSASA